MLWFYAWNAAEPVANIVMNRQRDDSDEPADDKYAVFHDDALIGLYGGSRQEVARRAIDKHDGHWDAHC